MPFLALCHEFIPINTTKLNLRTTQTVSALFAPRYASRGNSQYIRPTRLTCSNQLEQMKNSVTMSINNLSEWYQLPPHPAIRLASTLAGILWHPGGFLAQDSSGRTLQRRFMLATEMQGPWYLPNLCGSSPFKQQAALLCQSAS